MSSKRVLADALNRFEGTVVFVSHDRYFMRDVANRVIELHRPDQSRPAGLRDFAEGYDYYLWRTRAEADESPPATGDHSDDGRTAPRDAEPASAVDWKQRKEQKSRARKLEKEEGEVLEEIDRLEEEHGRVQEELALPEVYADGARVRELSGRLEEIDARRAELTERWEALAAERETLDGSLDG
jgi:ATP-binding cassette subfamily F protein 3